MKKYKLICKKGEGTFSEVVCGENVENGKQFAIKCMKISYDSLQQVNNLREIQALKRLTPHPHIVDLEEVLFDQPSGRLAMVFELMDINLYDLISGRRDHLDRELVRSLGYQMFLALDHMHRNGIFHRDIKPENILVDSTGKVLKLADLGSCRSINSKPPMTEYIATRWYRSPECLLTDGHYGPEMDMWGAGCVLFEVVALFPLFPGADEVDQVNRIHKVVGTPSEDILTKLKDKGSSKISYKFSSMPGIGIKHFIPHAKPDCVNLLNKTMIYDHTERLISSDAIEHPYFSEIRQKDKSVRPKPSKLTLRKNARVGDAKPVSINYNKQTKSKAKERIEKASDGDGGRENRRVVKVRSLQQGEGKASNLEPIKSSLRKAHTVKPSRTSKVPVDKPLYNAKKQFPEKPSNNIKNLSNQNRIRRLANNPRQPNKRNETYHPKEQTKPLKGLYHPKEQTKPLKGPYHPKEQTKPLKGTGMRTKKYGGIKSSGYGRSTSKAQQPLKSRRLQREDHMSGGTDKTTGLTVAESTGPAHRYQKSSLQKNKLSLADKSKRRERSEYNLPRIRA